MPSKKESSSVHHKALIRTEIFKQTLSKNGSYDPKKFFDPP